MARYLVKCQLGDQEELKFETSVSMLAQARFRTLISRVRAEKYGFASISEDGFILDHVSSKDYVRGRDEHLLPPRATG